jgi:hypothetical protein
VECPKCHKEITYVNVYSECWQKGFLNENKIINYGNVEVLETTEIECPECYASLWDFGDRYVEET